MELVAGCSLARQCVANIGLGVKGASHSSQSCHGLSYVCLHAFAHEGDELAFKGVC